MGSAEETRPTTLKALLYGFYGLLALVVVVAVLWLLDVVPGWVVPAVLALTVIAFVLLWRELERFRRASDSGPPAEDPRT